MLSKKERAYLEGVWVALGSFIESNGTIQKPVKELKTAEAVPDLLKFKSNTKDLIAEAKQLYGLTPIKLTDKKFQDLIWKHKIKQIPSTIKTMAARGLATYTLHKVGEKRIVMDTFTFTKL